MKTRLRHIEASLAREWSRALPVEAIAEMAIPSYYHSNPIFRWMFRRRLEVICAAVCSGAHDRVLDFGCGTGLLALNLASECEDLFVHDIETRVVSQAVTHFGLANVTILKGEMWHSVVSRRSLDVVVAADVLEHLPDMKDTIDLLETLLAPQGRVIISGPTENAVYRLGRLLARFRGDYHVRNIHDIRKAFLGKGFELEKITRLPIPFLVDAFHILVFRAPSSNDGAGQPIG